MKISPSITRFFDNRFRPSSRQLPPHPYEEQFSEQMDISLNAEPTSFLMIASTPRSGSHMLGHILGETGDFGQPLEYLHRGNARYWARRFGTNDLTELFLRIQAFRTSGNGRFCFKAHWDQFAPVQDSVSRLTRGRGLQKVIWIYRRSLLEQAVSFVVAAQTGVWISGAPATGTAEYNYDTISAAARNIHDQNKAWCDYLDRNFRDVTLVLPYETLVEGTGSVERFLGVTALPNRPKRTARQGGVLNLEWLERFRADVTAQDQWMLELIDWSLPTA